CSAARTLLARDGRSNRSFVACAPRAARSLPKRLTPSCSKDRASGYAMIQVRELHKSFGSQHVLRGVNLRIEKGLITVIIGGSGQGKTVLLKHLIGLEKPDSGQILVGETDIAPLGARQMVAMRQPFGMG